MSVPSGSIQFIAFHRPALLEGEYVLTAQQQVQFDDGSLGWGKSGGGKWAAAPSTQLQFSVAGPRFTLDPGLVQSRFPPPKSIGEYYNVLPHIIFNRTTLPWERTIDGAPPSNPACAAPWLALLLFDHSADGGAPNINTVTVRDLLTIYGQTATPTGQPEFVKLLPRSTSGAPGPGELKLEVGDHPEDRLVVIDVPKRLLWQLLPSEAEVALMAHVRQGMAANDPSAVSDYPVIFCNRLPAPGRGGEQPPVGTQSTVHLVSLEGRRPLLDALQSEPSDDNPVRLVSLANWSFATFQADKTFTLWLKDAWCPDGSRSDPADQTQASTCASGVLHGLRMPISDNADAEGFLAQGYVPIEHQTRQGNHVISWYRGPLLPGPGPVADFALPVRTSDQLLRYLQDVAMFDTSYAAAWELGRSLTLRSRKVSFALFNWKRSHAQQVRQAEAGASHLPFAPAQSIAPDFPDQVSQWFGELLCLEHIPFHYLVPRQEILPANSLRFFTVDVAWLECLLDGAFSVGRVSSADLSQDDAAREAGHVPSAPRYSGFLLRSHVVSGWPHLGVEAYSEAVPPDEATNYIPSVKPARLMRMDRLGMDILLCLFEGEIKTVDIHEHPESIHFGVDMEDPNKLDTYYKDLRRLDGNLSGKRSNLPWKRGINTKRVVNMTALAAIEGAGNSAEFAVTMIEGVEKVRFIKQIGAASHQPDVPAKALTRPSTPSG